LQTKKKKRERRKDDSFIHSSVDSTQIFSPYFFW